MLRTRVSALLGLSAIHAFAVQPLPSPEKLKPILSKYCTECHEGAKAKAGLRFTDPSTIEPDHWFRMLDQIEAGKMPPEDEAQPSATQRATLTHWIRNDLTTALLARQQENGRAEFRRLNRNEYANTLFDLTGIRPQVEDELPSDGRVDGYDKIAAALPMSSEATLGYVEIAEEILKNVLKPTPPDSSRTVHAIAQESGESPGHSLVLDGGNTIVSFNSDTSSGRVKYPGASYSGMHKLRISAYAHQTDKPLAFGVYIGQPLWFPQRLKLTTVLEVRPGGPSVIETEVYMHKGQSLRLIPFGLGVPVPKNSQATSAKGPGLALQWIDIIEPEFPLAVDRFFTADLAPALHAELLHKPAAIIADKPSDPYASQTTTRETFLADFERNYRRVFTSMLRRDPTDEEMAATLRKATTQLDAKTRLDTIITEPFTDLLLSPDFLCVVESSGKLDDFSLASRLARFLWNSTPDAELLLLAREKKLGNPATLIAQTNRLLSDPRSARFVADFTDQWLGLRGIDETTPDSKLHPHYDDWVKFSSVAETRMFIRELIDKDLPITDLVDPKFSFINLALANHYGLPAVSHTDLRKTALPPDSPYGGVWTQASVMKVTANGTNTSPVKRGVWVSERLLGIHIPPPPPDINPIEPDTRGAKTVREQLAKHRESKSCAACHARFDGYGFALENFDVTGAFRQTYRILTPENKAADGPPVDPSGNTPDGTDFTDIRQLRSHLARSPDKLALGLTRHLVTYATGARPSGVDEPRVLKIVENTKGQGHSFRSIIHQLVLSDLFRCK